MENIRQVCTKETPMPFKSEGVWIHTDAKETEYNGDHYIEMKCPHCNLIFTTEMPD